MSKFAIRILLTAILWIGMGLPSCCMGQERTWSDVTNTFQIVAELVSYDETTVTLKKPDGERITVDLNKLSAADNQYVARLRESAMPPKSDFNRPAVSEDPTASQSQSPLIPQPRPTRLPRFVNPNPRTVSLDPTHLSGLDLPPRPIKKSATAIRAPIVRTTETTIPNPRMANEGPRETAATSPVADTEQDLVRLRQQLVELEQAWPANPAPALIQELVNLSSSDDKFLRLTSLQLIGRHDGAQQFDAIIARLDDPDFEIRWIAYDIVESLHDDRAIEPLLARFASEDVNKIASILQTYGSEIESKLRPFLDHQSRDTRLAACNLLGKIATRSSLTRLEQLQVEDPDLLVRMQAKGAVRQITARTGGQ